MEDYEFAALDRMVTTCASEKTAEGGVWISVERRGPTPMKGNSDFSERIASSTGSCLVRVVVPSDFLNFYHVRIPGL